MNAQGLHLHTSFAGFSPDSGDDNHPAGQIGTEIITSYLRLQNNLMPTGSSELVRVLRDGFSWTVAFAGIPRIGVMLSVLAIMENNVRPYLVDGCVFTVVFNFGTDDELSMTSVTPEFVPNANTYSDCIQFVSRGQHRCYE